MCIRCRDVEAAGELGLCEGCAIATCIEYLNGLERLEDYLGSWAAFEEWLERRELQAA
jgi:hypothetical protein